MPNEIGDRVKILDESNINFMTNEEVAEIMETEYSGGGGSSDLPPDYEGDVSDEDILKLLEDDTSENGSD